MTQNYDLAAFDNEAPIATDEIAPCLLAEAPDSHFMVFSCPELDDSGIRTGAALQIMWCEDDLRAGIAYVGSGSDDSTRWTNACSPADALRRWNEDDIAN